MRRSMVAALAVLVSVHSQARLAEVADVTPSISFRTENGRHRLRLEVLVNDQSPSVAWEAFLDRLFGYFDRDNDDRLSSDECRRMLSLPLLNKEQLHIDLVEVDDNRDATCSRGELKAFCRKRGFTPIVIFAEPPSAEDLRLSRVFHELLDANGDGQITSAELRRAPRSMGRCDLNEDDFLDHDELLSGSAAPVHATVAPPETAMKAHGEDGGLRISFGVKLQAAVVEQFGNSPLRIVESAASVTKRFRGPGNQWNLTLAMRRRLPNVASASEFLSSQFQATLVDQSALAVSEIKRNATLSGLFELAAFADRDGDDRLAPSELAAYTELIATAVQSQVYVAVTDRAFNLFPFLDSDADGRLSYIELTQTILLGEGVAMGTLPRQYELSFSASPARSWGGMLMPAITKSVPKASKGARSGPRWFQALDLNEDDVVTPREFLGTPETFKKLDRNHDGIITIAETANHGS